jgi:hypothetical protein
MVPSERIGALRFFGEERLGQLLKYGLFDLHKLTRAAAL